nr:N-acetylglucosamine-6-phosphate deacetylase [Paenibacillus humicola]
MGSMATNGDWRIRGVRIIAGDRIVDGSVTVKDGKIAEIAEAGSESAFEGTAIDGGGGWLLPGFIDMHVHGGGGADFMDASREAYETITRFHASKGTTRMLATTVTAPPEAIEAVLAAAGGYRQGEMPYAALEGVHLEGPFISELWPGAQNPAFIAPPRPDWVEAWTERHPGLIRQLTLAPEKAGATGLIRRLAQQGVVVSCGHTDAKYDEILAAADAGLSQAVHTYNAMRGLHHREPGTLGAVLTDPRLYAELIADGHHVHPAAIRLVVLSKPADKVVLITDAIAAAGLGDGDYRLGGLAVDVRQGVARLREGGSLAGSTLTMIDAVRFMLAHSGLPLPAISRMASANPAKQLGLGPITGSIETGKLADLVLADSGLNAVRSTWVAGRNVFAAE